MSNTLLIYLSIYLSISLDQVWLNIRSENDTEPFLPSPPPEESDTLEFTNWESNVNTRCMYVDFNKDYKWIAGDCSVEYHTMCTSTTEIGTQ